MNKRGRGEKLTLSLFYMYNIYYVFRQISAVIIYYNIKFLAHYQFHLLNIAQQLSRTIKKNYNYRLDVRNNLHNM